MKNAEVTQIDRKRVKEMIDWASQQTERTMNMKTISLVGDMIDLLRTVRSAGVIVDSYDERSL